MKKLFALAAILAMLVFGLNQQVLAQNEGDDTTVTEDVIPDEILESEETPDEVIDEATENEGQFHRKLKEKFIEGGPFFMSFVLIALILGLALSIERIIYLKAFLSVSCNKIL